MRRTHWGRPSPKIVDMTGERIGRVTVERRVPNRSNSCAAWLVRCDCGAELIVEGIRLRRAVKLGDTRFCCKACRQALRAEARATP